MDSLRLLALPHFMKLPHSLPLLFLGCLVLPVFRAAAAESVDPIRARAASTGIITGRVLDTSSGAYLHKARVIIEGTALEAFSDDLGLYRFDRVPAGRVTLRAEYAGLSAQKTEVTVSAGSSSNTDFELAAAHSKSAGVVKLGAFKVAEGKEMSQASLAQQEERFKANFANVISTEEFGIIPEGNVAEFLKFLPGVTVGGGQDAREISIGGVPAAYTPINVDGLALASAASSNANRTIELEQVTMTNLARVEVDKTQTPDQRADAIGGQVNLIPRSSFERSKPVFNYRFSLTAIESVTLDPLSFKREPGPYRQPRSGVLPAYEISAVVPLRKDRLGLTFSLGDYNRRTYLRNDNFTWSNHGAIPAGSIATSPENPYARLYSVVDGGSQTRQQSGSVGLDFKLGRSDVFKLGLDYTFYYATFSDKTLALDVGRATAFTATSTTGAMGAGGINASISQRDKTGTTYTPSLRYWHRGPVWTLEGAAGISHSTNQYRDIDKGYFQTHSSAITGVNINFTDLNKMRPGGFQVSRTVGGTTVPVDPFRVADYVIRTVGSAQIESQSVTSSANFSARRTLDLGLPIRVKTGVDFRRNQRDLARESYQFPGGTWVGPDRIALSADDASTPYLDTPHSTKPGPSGLPSIPWVNNFLLWEDYVAHPSYVVPNYATAYTTRAAASRFFEETVSSGYLRFDAKPWQRLSVTGGVRWEHTDDYGEGPLTDPSGKYQKDSAGNVVRNTVGQPVLATTDPLEQAKRTTLYRGVKAESAYASYYPSVMGTFNVTANLQARASYGRTLGRPNLGSIIPGVTIPEPSIGVAREVISITNTALQPWTANNYALGLEYYFENPSAGSLSIRTFQRDVTNFFVSVDRDITPDFLAEFDLSTEYDNAIVRTTRNDSTRTQRLFGTELAYSQSLAFLPSAWGQVRVYANAAHFAARPSTTGDLATGPGEVYNWGINHAYQRLRVALNWNHVGLTRTSQIANTPTVGPSVWSYNAPSTRVDGSGEFRLTRTLSLFAAAKNLLNTKREFLRYGPTTPYYARQNQSSETGVSWSLGVKGTF